jgi:SAM-dependent methyltransferase
MSAEDHARRAVSFGARAAEYARGRPSYPEEAVRFCLPAGAQRVLDLGAGTGKLTRALLDLGLDVVAIEPLDEMRALIPDVATVLEGSAEAIPLADESVDAVVVGQAFHWFDRGVALDEIARVIRPDGTLGVLGNLIEPEEPWTREIAEMVGEADKTIDGGPPFPGGLAFGEPQLRVVRHEQALDADALVDNVSSRSVVIVREAAEQEAVLERVRAIAPPGRFAMPLVCAAWRYSRSRRFGQLASGSPIPLPGE